MVCDTASTRRLMARHPELCDVCTAALVDALRKPSAESRKWTGRKVLAFMEVVKESERFLPTHGVALGVVATDLGVPMGLVRNSLGKVIPDKETEEWCVNLIRICGSSNDEQYDYKTKSYIQKEQNEAFFTKIPNRSKQLALWSTVRSSNPLLTQLVTRLFLDAGAREAFVGCCAGVTEDASKSGKNSANTTSEIVAALASNCTSDKPLCAFLSALINQSGASDTRRAKLTQLLKSETDSDAPRPT
ncbi:hypothetical protein AGDE_13479 [Angomonas deanei]|nr:hypothetical protein AGDE_13479 [Angomonas deanei]|eukprot:EPY22312.1 hypothetical protein AGDE_13479 [Angomonas deanei]